MVNITCALLCVRTESAVRKRHMLCCLQNDWPNAYTVAELLFASFDHMHWLSPSLYGGLIFPHISLNVLSKASKSFFVLPNAVFLSSCYNGCMAVQIGNKASQAFGLCR